MDSIIDHVRRIVAIYITPYSSELKSTWIGLAVTTFAILSSGSLKASYGRHFESHAIIPTVNGKLGWMSMEIISPIAASLLFAAYKIQGPSVTKGGVLLVLWLLHYSNRALISVLLSPHMTNSRVDTVLMSMFFNLINGGWIGHDLGQLNAQPFVIDMRTLLGARLIQIQAVAERSDRRYRRDHPAGKVGPSASCSGRPRSLRFRHLAEMRQCRLVACGGG